MDKRAYLRQRIEFFLSFSKDKISVPSITIVDDVRIKRISVIIQLNEDYSLQSMEIYASTHFFGEKTFDAVLCHELGHIVAFSKKIHYPLMHFRNRLKNELSADKEGLKIFMAAGKKGLSFGKPFDYFFRTFIKKFFKLKGKTILLQDLTQSVIRSFAILIFVFRHAIMKV